MALWDIMPLGDSVTEGQSSSLNYRSRLASLLQGANVNSSFLGSMTTNIASFPVGFTHHEGHSGWCSYDGPLPGVCQAGIASWDPSRPIGIDDNITTWYTNNAADIVLLLIGINDGSSSVLQTHVGSIVDKILAVNPSAKILVSKIRTNGNAQSTKNNAIAAAVAGKSNTTLVDAYSGWVDSTMFAADDIHPNQTGYNQMADNWYALIQTAINPSSQIDSTTPAGVQPNGFAGGYTLVMSDEFNSSTLNAKWRAYHDAGDHSTPTAFDLNAGGNSALRLWWNGNTSTDSQYLVSNGTHPFRTRFGFFEARIKCIAGKGLFPAFWLYPMSNTGAENPDGTQQEIDIVEWFGLENGDWLVDTVNYRCKNASFTVWTEGGGGNKTQAGYRRMHTVTDSADGLGAQGFFPGYNTTISTAWHTYGMRWDQSTGAMQFYFDGVAIGVPVQDPWGSANNIQLCVLLQLWWGNGTNYPLPNSTGTITGPPSTTTALQDGVQAFDYVRVWSIGGPTVTFNASLTAGPNDGTTISGIVNFQIQGDLIANAELLPGDPTLYTPLYGRFTLTNDASNHVTGALSWDTTALANGSITVRISAFNSAPGIAGTEIIVMTRTYLINNVTGGPNQNFCYDDLGGLQGLKK